MENFEHFSVQWNDYQDTVISSFSQIGKTKDFHDVTLISDDNKLIESHRILLSACSSFFENILQKIKSPHPFIYLKGIKSKELSSVVEFIYEGKVNVYKEDLDQFLAVADDLKLKGFSGNSTKKEMIDDPDVSEKNKDSHFEGDPIQIDVEEEKYEHNNQQVLMNPLHSESGVGDHLETKNNIGGLEFYKNTIGKYQCDRCEYQAERKDNLKRHIQSIHEGLRFSCNQCEYQATRQGSLKRHKQNVHGI